MNAFKGSFGVHYKPLSSTQNKSFFLNQFNKSTTPGYSSSSSMSQVDYKQRSVPKSTSSILAFKSLASGPSSSSSSQEGEGYQRSYKSTSSSSKSSQKPNQTSGWAQSNSNYSSAYADTYGGVASNQFNKPTSSSSSSTSSTATSSSVWKGFNKGKGTSSKKPYKPYKSSGGWKNKPKASPVKSRASQPAGVYARPSSFNTTTFKTTNKASPKLKKENFEW
jgi:hypothetical protein